MLQADVKWVALIYRQQYGALSANVVGEEAEESIELVSGKSSVMNGKAEADKGECAEDVVVESALTWAMVFGCP